MSVNQIRSSTGYSVPSEALIDQVLPIDVFEFVLKKLNDVNAARSVSKYWYQIRLTSIKQFQSSCLMKLNYEVGIKEILLCGSFTGLQATVFKMRDQIVEVLKPLSEDQLDEMESQANIPPHLFLGKVFKLTKICKNLDKAWALTYLDWQGEELNRCVLGLVRCRMFGKAIELSRKIQVTYWRQLSFREISGFSESYGKF